MAVSLSVSLSSTEPRDAVRAVAVSSTSSSSLSSSAAAGNAVSALTATATPADDEKHVEQDAALLEKERILDTQQEAQSQSQPHTLHVLFSAPLAGFDRSGKAHALESLDHVEERDALVQVFREAQRDVNLHFDFATADALRTLLSLGSCRALHFSGHGLPRGLCFEDGRAGLHVMNVQQLTDLLAAGGLALEFVFVSACYSKEIGETFVKAGVQHVVCVKIESKVRFFVCISF